MSGFKRPREELAPDQCYDQRFKQQKVTLPTYESGMIAEPSVPQDHSVCFRAAAWTPIDSPDADDDEDRCKSPALHSSTGIAVSPSYAPAPLIGSAYIHANARKLASPARNAPWLGNFDHQHVAPSASLNPFDQGQGQLNSPAGAWNSTVALLAPGPTVQASMQGEEYGGNRNSNPTLNSGNLTLDIGNPSQNIGNPTPNVGLPSPVSDYGTAVDNHNQGDIHMAEDNHGLQETLAASYPLPQSGEKSAQPHPTQTRKPKIFMGYRSDCEKCRTGVPGHYNHIL